MIDPGARMLERASMPELSGFDEPARPDAFLNAARRGAISQVDATVVQAAFRRRTRALRWPSLQAVSRGRVPGAIGRLWKTLSRRPTLRTSASTRQRLAPTCAPGSNGKAPSGRLDMEIAAHAIALDVILVTNARRELSRVAGFRCGNRV